MKVYVVIGENRRMHNISAHAAFTTRTAAEKWAKDPKENWLSDRWAINEVDLDLEIYHMLREVVSCYAHLTGKDEPAWMEDAQGVLRKAEGKE